MAKIETGLAQPPADLVNVGYISGAYGIQGWIKVKPYSSSADVILKVKNWWLDLPELHDVEVMQSRWQGKEIVVRLMGIANREAAEALRGTVIQISRQHFPVLPDNEFYWVDLIGLSVFNVRGDCLGIVKGLIDNGAHPILQVAVSMPEGTVSELLIPFVDQYIGEIDQSNKKVTVDWELDY